MTARSPDRLTSDGDVATEDAAEAEDSGAALKECETDPLSVRGLRRLAREDEKWRARLLAAWKRPEVRVEVLLGRSREATLRSAILAFGFELRGTRRRSKSVETVRKARQVLAAVVEAVGGWPVDEHGIDWDELYGRLTEGSEPDSSGRLSRDRASRALCLVQKALARRARKLGLPPVVRPKRPASMPRVPRRGRRSIPLKSCATLIRDARPGERAKIGLALGGGLLPSQVDGLGGEDVATWTVPRGLMSRGVPAGFRTVWVRLVGPNGLAHWVPVPHWVARLLGEVRLGAAGAPLIGREEAPTLDATIRRLRGQVRGLEDMTAGDLCLTWQAVALRLGLRRDVIRRTWRQHQAGELPARWHPVQRQLVWLAAQWPTLMCDATRGLIERGELVPRRAPSGCGAHEAERGWRSRKRDAPPLPAGVILPSR